MPYNIHASLVCVGTQGVLIRGRPGSGKSELALRLIDQPGFGLGPALITAQLVADDRVELFSSTGQLFGKPPENLAGLLEIRGLGLVRLKNLPQVKIDLCVELTETSERLPGFFSQTTEIAEFSLPLLKIMPFSPSAPARIRAGLAILANPGQLHA